MKKVVLFLLCIFLTGCTSNNTSTSIQPDEGHTSSAIIDQGILCENDKVYDISVSDNAGHEITLSDTFDTPTILWFWTTWAEGSKEINQVINEVSIQYSNIDYISINTLALEKDNLETIIKKNRESNYNYNVYFDHDNTITQKYHINSFPTLYIINTSG